MPLSLSYALLVFWATTWWAALPRHYPALAGVVRWVCARHGIRPHDHATLGGALAARVRHLYRLGRPVMDQALDRRLPLFPHTLDEAPKLGA